MSDVLSWLSSNLSLLIWAHFPSFSFTPRDEETQHPSQLPYTPRGTGGEGSVGPPGLFCRCHDLWKVLHSSPSFLFGASNSILCLQERTSASMSSAGSFASP